MTASTQESTAPDSSGANDSVKQTHGFQAEAKQLLHLMIHSLYSNKEIFLRELVSNASDAADKLRFAALKDDSLYGDDPELKIVIESDSEAKTVTITDNGIGMSKDEVMNNLGTIAKSGTAEFLKQMTGDEKKDSQLIGQFGVGFYSAFIVADRVEVFTRKAGLDASEGVHWESSGEADYQLESVEKAERGTRIVLHLRNDSEEFSDNWRLRSIVKKYANHISIPVMLEKPEPPASTEDGDGKSDDKSSEQEIKVPEFEAVNDATALWIKARNDIKDEEYKDFYKSISHDFADPLKWSHNKVEGKLEYTSCCMCHRRRRLTCGTVM